MKILPVIITFICIASLSFFLFTGCTTTPAVSYYIRFKVDGVDKNFDKGLTNYESEPFGQIVTWNPDYTDLRATPDVETGEDLPLNNYISIQFYGFTTGSYIGLEEAIIAYNESGAKYLATDISVNVTRYDAEEGGVIEGTFSATITPVPPNGSKEITEGEFKVKRVARDLFVP
jgi:hypothetical protein